MTSQYSWAVVAAIWGLVVPGLPIVLYVRKRFSISVDIAIASPFISLGVNYATVCMLNLVEFHLPLELIACAFLALSIVLVFLTLQLGSQLLKVNFNTIIVICSTSFLSIYVWTKAYSGYLFVAPNTDGRHHNFYVARIMEIASALPKDVLVPSPLSPMGIANDFYPLAWHTVVAVPAALFNVPSAPATMVSALVFWAVVMPIGILRLAKLFRHEAYFLGPIAALLSQVIPLVPGIPMSWGAFPSVIGIALLPGALYLVVLAGREVTTWSALLALVVIIVLMLVHPPEAFSVLLLTPLVVIAVLLRHPSRRIFSFLGGGAALICLMMAFQWDLISRKFAGLEENVGAVATFDHLISSFLQMNMNTGFEQVTFAVLMIGGLIIGRQSTKWNWLGLTFFLFLVVYLASGAAGAPLGSFRFLALPWYTSYERTLWVCVPIAVIYVANCFEGLLNSVRTSNWKLSVLAIPLTLVIATNLLSSLTPAAISILRKGPFDNEIVAKEDFGVFERAALVQGETGIIYSEVNQGSIYAYVYDGVRVTNGNFGRNGLYSDYVTRINTGLRSICGDLVAQESFGKEEVKAVLLSTRNAGWEGSVWTREEIRTLPGFQVASEGKYSYLLVPNFGSCSR
jgi:hypothetical protein